MFAVLNERKALDTLSNYFTLLESTGYVKHTTVKRFLIYLFLVDFVDSVCELLTEEDYRKIDKALSVLFTGAGCLLPYPVFCVNRAKLGMNWNMSRYLAPRISEDKILRIVEEQDKLRTE